MYFDWEKKNQSSINKENATKDATKCQEDICIFMYTASHIFSIEYKSILYNKRFSEYIAYIKLLFEVRREKTNYNV